MCICQPKLTFTFGMHYNQIISIHPWPPWHEMYTFTVSTKSIFKLQFDTNAIVEMITSAIDRQYFNEKKNREMKLESIKEFLVTDFISRIFSLIFKWSLRP